MDDVRLDKYLWAVRIFKTRSDAAEAIRTNRVTVGGATCKHHGQLVGVGGFLGSGAKV